MNCADIRAELRRIREQIAGGDESEIWLWVIPGKLACSQRPLRDKPEFGAGNGKSPPRLPPEALRHGCALRQLLHDRVASSPGQIRDHRRSGWTRRRTWRWGTRGDLGILNRGVRNQTQGCAVPIRRRSRRFCTALLPGFSEEGIR